MAGPRPRSVTGRCGGLMYTWSGCPGVPVRLTCLYERVSAILSLPEGGTMVPAALGSLAAPGHQGDPATHLLLAWPSSQPVDTFFLVYSASCV